jgi:hypothetical protein
LQQPKIGLIVEALSPKGRGGAAVLFDWNVYIVGGLIPGDEGQWCITVVLSGWLQRRSCLGRRHGKVQPPMKIGLKEKQREEGFEL